MSEVEKAINELATTFASIHEAYGNAANTTICHKLASEFAGKFKAAQRADALDVLASHDWSNTPKTISELRAEKARDASKWSARDILLVALREIDSGQIKPQVMIVLYAEDNREKGETYYNWWLSNPPGLPFPKVVTAGLLGIAQNHVLSDDT